MRVSACVPSCTHKSLTHTCSELNKHPRNTQTAQQHKYNSSEPHKGTYQVYISYVRRNTCVPSFPTCNTPGFEVSHASKANIFIIILYDVMQPYTHATHHRIPVHLHLSGQMSFSSFFSFSPFHLLSSPFFSLSLLVVTQIRGHTTGASPPLPTTVRALHFYRDKISAFSSLVDSRRIHTFLIVHLLAHVARWEPYHLHDLPRFFPSGLDLYLHRM